MSARDRLEARLTQVRWVELSHAFADTAANVPDLLRAIVDAPEEEDALGDLSEALNHQGSIYGATFAAVPAVAAAITCCAPESEARRSLTRLLGGIGEGARFASAIGESPAPLLGWLTAIAEESGALIDPPAAADTQLRTYNAHVLGQILAAIADLRAFSGDGDVAARAAAFADLDARCVLSLTRTAEHDPEALPQSSALFALGAVADRAETAAVVSGAFERGTWDSAVIVAASLAQFEGFERSGGRLQVTDFAFETVSMTLISLEKHVTDVFRVRAPDGKELWRSPWFKYHLRFTAVETLTGYARGSEARLARVLPFLCTAIELSDKRLASRDLLPTLRLIWPDRRRRLEHDGARLKVLAPPPLDHASLTEAGRSVLESCLGTGALWSARGAGEELDLLAEIGAPVDRGALAAWLRPVEDVESRAMACIAAALDVDASAVHLDTRFAEDLGAGELAMNVLTVMLEDEFGLALEVNELNAVLTLRDLVAFIKRHGFT